MTPVGGSACGDHIAVTKFDISAPIIWFKKKRFQSTLLTLVLAPHYDPSWRVNPTIRLTHRLWTVETNIYLLHLTPLHQLFERKNRTPPVNPTGISDHSWRVNPAIRLSTDCRDNMANGHHTSDIFVPII